MNHIYKKNICLPGIYKEKKNRKFLSEFLYGIENSNKTMNKLLEKNSI